MSLSNYHVAKTYDLEEKYCKTLDDLKGQNYFRVKRENHEIYEALDNQVKIDYLEAILESLKPRKRDLWGY